MEKKLESSFDDFNSDSFKNKRFQKKPMKSAFGNFDSNSFKSSALVACSSEVVTPEQKQQQHTLMGKKQDELVAQVAEGGSQAKVILLQSYLNRGYLILFSENLPLQIDVNKSHEEEEEAIDFNDDGDSGDDESDEDKFTESQVDFSATQQKK